MAYSLELYLEDLFFTPQNQIPLIKEENWQIYLEKWLNSLDLDFDPTKIYEMTLRLTNDEDIKSFNAQFRDKNQPTDVLSFAALETDFPDFDMDLVALGDVIISVETAEKQAQLHLHSLEIELLWLASHGFLHLLGWDHPDDESLKEMLNLQKFLLHTIGIESESLKEWCE
ncbi:rRNA maturation RNase YbeY [Cyanobacterium aponinum]|uniref:Endoribonuclease YbeY n=1 Tax=Cyanobacterium aponinum (strain PCC 10605) TaxID=755178 RepID=K9Z9I4_CYAAP|nr:rRNA maturation RNase YbeY [Cyanobacterium aponinum]AFZ55235.1 metalloprotease ybeY [Cyanobacterium aponinum PCC 10605]